MPPAPWMPCPWYEELAGCLWLPRLLEKGRRALQGERRGQDLMQGYLFGDLDYADGQLIRFLRTSEARVRQLLGESAEDGVVAQRLIQESGRTAEEVAGWNRRFRRRNRPFIAMWEADEGRRPPGLGTSLLRGFYNGVLMPPVYLVFWAGRRWRARAGS